MNISLNNYSKILQEIKKTIEIASANINQKINQEKVLMSWKVGEIIANFLDGNAEYGSQLILQLERDLLISQSTLYQMRNFHKAYPDLTENDIHLNWSHYRSLITVKDEKKRKEFETLALENALSSTELETEIRNVKTPPANNTEPTKLYPRRGELFNYQLTTLAGSDKTFIDCGFKVFYEIQTDLSTPATVKSSKDKNGAITLVETKTPKAKFYTYKAHLEKVVDGDTLRVVLDLGFNIHHKEILRLKGINAPEAKTAEGKQSTAALTAILKDVEFLVIKTNKVDIYGRYVADVFFLKNEEDVDKVAAKGIYLNRILLEEGVVELY